MRVEADKAIGRIAIMPFFVDVTMPLPLQAKDVGVEFITFLWSADRIFGTCLWLLVSQYRFATAITILVNADNRPIVHPLNWLQVYQTAGSTYILEVHEPVFTFRSIYPTTLVRTINRSISLCQYSLPFIRTIYILGTEHHLPTCRNTTSWMEDVIVSITLVELRTFASLMSFVTVENNA